MMTMNGNGIFYLLIVQESNDEIDNMMFVTKIVRIMLVLPYQQSRLSIDEVLKIFAIWARVRVPQLMVLHMQSSSCCT